MKFSDCIIKFVLWNYSCVKHDKLLNIAYNTENVAQLVKCLPKIQEDLGSVISPALAGLDA